VAERPSLQVAVVMRRERIDNRWQAWRWSLDDVLPQIDAMGTEVRRLPDDGRDERWLHPGFTVQLFRDDAEGYHLNAATEHPGWFVLWRMEEQPTIAPEAIPRPVVVTLSYHEAGRWLDAQESVEQVPAPPEVVEWLRAFVDEHYAPAPKRRQRPESFRPPQDRFGGGGQGG
jgi:hypothetical protein